MEIINYINQFDTNIKRAYEQIGDNITLIDKTDEKIRGVLEKFRKELETIDISGKNVFEKELEEIIAIYKEKCADWCLAIEQFIKGKEFVNQFERSVLVVVFGNVNVGKSSIGNLIAGVEDTSKATATSTRKKVFQNYFGEAPKFYEYDMAGEKSVQGVKEREECCFKEGYTETTATIQYFTRNNGLTWTDSPGIHSVNKENGDLAKKYVDYADLVIFVTTSSSPAKNDEVQELQKLFQKKKPVLILINKSDTYDIDEENGEIVKKLVPKSKTDRKKQENYVKQLFQEENQMFSQIDATSISTLLAVKAIEDNDVVVFEQSGIPYFYEKLGDVLSKKAVDLKMTAPKTRINAVIDEIVNGGSIASKSICGIKEFNKEICDMIIKLQECSEKVNKIAVQAKAEIIGEVNKKVISKVQDATANVRKGDASMDLSKEVNEIVKNEVSKTLTEKLGELLSDISSQMIENVSFSGVQHSKVELKYDTYTRKEYYVKTVKRDPQGIIERIEHFFTGKEYTTDSIRTRTITETIQNGDNSVEVQNKIQQEIEVSMMQYLEKYAKQIVEEYFAVEEQVLKQLQALFQKLQKELEEMKLVC